MPEILIELSEDALRKIEAVAQKEKRSRRAQVSVILEEYLEREHKRALA